MLFLLLQFKLKTVTTVSFSLAVILLAIWGQMYLTDSKETQSSDGVVSDGVFELELEKILSGGDAEINHPEVPVMVWWNPFTGDDGLQNCGKHSCYVSNDRNFIKHPNLKNIFFYGTILREYDLPQLQEGVDWSLYHEESPKNNQLFSHPEMMALFNHTATFRSGSDYPLTTQYLEGVDQLTDLQFVLPVQDKNRYIGEDGLASVVYVQSGCDAPSQRDEWVKEFMKHVPVDSYGSCLHNKDLPEELNGSEQMENKDFYKLLGKYKFMLTLENGLCEDYITEKLWRALQLGVIPIYLGAPNVDEYIPNPGSIISVQNYSSVEEVAGLVNSINGDDQLYMTYLRHKTEQVVENLHLKQLLQHREWGVSTEQQIQLGNSVRQFQCFVCNRINENMKYQKIGFAPVKYRADAAHYGCPMATHPITKQVDMEYVHTRDWYRTKFAVEILRDLLDKRETISADQFNHRILDRWIRYFNEEKQKKNDEL